jgi:protein involved in polysaccharide export with SLBB domain
MLVSLVFIPQGWAQDAHLANSSPSYQVTAGDVYTLTYGSVSVTIAIDYTYRIVIPHLGVFNVEGKTFQQLKRELEAIINNTYPQSGAQLVLSSPSSFRVYLGGEVNNPGERSTWAMGRLSSLLGGSLSVHSSKRNITVTSLDGQVKTYDLFKAEHFGDLTQNPYLRPEDVVTIQRIDRMVSIFGEVTRPESYELLPEENLQDLVTNYAGGYTSLADIQRIEITRYIENSRGVHNKIYPFTGGGENYPLQHLDVIYIPPK